MTYPPPLKRLAVDVIYKNCKPLEAETLQNYTCHLPTSLLEFLSYVAVDDFLNCDNFNLYKMDLCELLEEKVRHRKLCLSHSQNTLYHRSLKCLISQCSYINSQSTKVLLSKLPPKVIFDSCAMFRGYWWSEVTSKFKTSRRCRLYCYKKNIKHKMK